MSLKVRFLVLALTFALSGPVRAYAGYSDGEMRATETTDEGKIRDLRDQEVKQLNATLSMRMPKNRRADLYFRLAEIYLEAYHSEYVLEGRVHEKHLSAGVNESGIDHLHSKPYLTLGIKSSKDILSLGISYPKLDQVYYFLGFNYAELGDLKESTHYFQELVKRFPSSEFASEAYHELGDTEFDATHYRKALGYYQQAIDHGKSEAIPRIYHKLAWCYYRTKQFDLAISTMKKAIELSQTSGEKFLSLREEALRDMAVFYTETDRVDEAIAYFRDTIHDPSFYPAMLERLGKQYERNVEPIKATQVYESLLKTNPDSEASYRVLVKLVDLDLRRGHYAQAIARIQTSRLRKSPKKTLASPRKTCARWFAGLRPNSTKNTVNRALTRHPKTAPLSKPPSRITICI
jgi:tetratricopeptide (TPR) repeat protein